MAVSLSAFEREADANPVAVPSRVERREIAEDSVLDPVSFRIDVDRLRDFQRRILLDRYIADKARDLFFSGHGRRDEEQSGKRRAENPHGQAAGRAKSTFGAVCMLLSSSS